MSARLKVLYLIALSPAIFLVRDPRFLAAVLIAHLIVAPFVGVKARHLARLFWKMRYFVAFLLVVQALFPPKGHFLIAWLETHAPDLFHRLGGSDASSTATRPSRLLGLSVGCLQMVQVFTMVLLAHVVRKSGGPGDFVAGLRGWFLPASTATVIDACFGQLEAADADRPTRRRAAHHEAAPVATRSRREVFRSLLRGDVGWILEKLEGQIGDDEIATDGIGERDIRLMTRITFVLMSLRMLKVTPGTGLTPGHQNLIVLPLLCLAAERTHRRWGATVVGGASGVLSVMLGLGRNGVFILPAHVLPGLVVDLGWRSVGRQTLRRWQCMALGAAAGFSRFTGMLFVLLLLDNPELLAAVPFLSLGHVVFGCLSGTVTYSLIRHARERGPEAYATVDQASNSSS